MTATTACSRLLASFLLPALLLLLALPAGAQEAGQAGLVIQFGEDQIQTFCLDVPAGGAQGLDLLQASGLELVADVSSGMGVSVCQIEGLGCTYPAQHCFCQCMGGSECAYWNYFYRDPGAETWTYSPLGAVLHSVLPGSVEAWVWGDGRTPPAENLTFEAVCGLTTATATVATPAVATSQPAGVEATQEATVPAVTPALPASVTSPPPAGATPAPAGETRAGPRDEPGTSGEANGAGSGGSYVAFAAMLLLLAGAGVLTWLRRR